MTNKEKIKYLKNGYGAWFADTNDIHPANVTAVIDKLLASPVIEDAFHQERKEIWIKFHDSKNISGNRFAIEAAFSINTF